MTAIGAVNPLFILPPRANTAAAGSSPAPETEKPSEEESSVIERLKEAAFGESDGADIASIGQLSEEEEKQVDELKKIDFEVRSHEQAHKTVGGAYAGPIQYETVTGPDGREYAVAGEVAIDASPIPGNPQATIQKMDIVIRAALAPAEPSPQDFAVARAAQQARAQAQKELQEQQAAEQAEARGDEETQSPLAQLLQSLRETEELIEETQGARVDITA